MISEATSNLIDLLKTVSGFQNRVGLDLGGTGINPNMKKIDYPYAWVLFDGDSSQDPGSEGRSIQQMKINFVVYVYIPHGLETNMISNDLPLLESVSAAVRGKQGPIGSLKWKYEGQVLREVEADYLRFEQHYSILGTYTT